MRLFNFNKAVIQLYLFSVITGKSYLQPINYVAENMTHGCAYDRETQFRLPQENKDIKYRVK